MCLAADRSYNIITAPYRARLAIMYSFTGGVALVVTQKSAGEADHLFCPHGTYINVPPVKPLCVYLRVASNESCSGMMLFACEALPSSSDAQSNVEPFARCCHPY